MICHRCGTKMFTDTQYTGSGSVDSWACIKCGNRDDKTIRANRRLGNAARRKVHKNYPRKHDGQAL